MRNSFFTMIKKSKPQLANLLLGWEDSNPRMAGPKPAALPLGYTPIKIADTKFNILLHLSQVAVLF